MSGFSKQTLPLQAFIDDLPQLADASSGGGVDTSVGAGTLDLRRFRSLLIDAKYSDTGSIPGDLATFAQLSLLWGGAKARPQAGDPHYSSVDVLNVRNTNGVPLNPTPWVGQYMRVPVRAASLTLNWKLNGPTPQTSLTVYGSGQPCDAPQFFPGPTSPQPFTLLTADALASATPGPFTTVSGPQNGGVKTLAATLTQLTGTVVTTASTAAVQLYTIAYTFGNSFGAPAIVPIGSWSFTANMPGALNQPTQLGSPQQVAVPAGPLWAVVAYSGSSVIGRTYQGQVTLT